MSMISLFNETSFKCSKLITRSYSTSFSLGIKMLDASLHDAVYSIYGMVRYADEIVDTFHDFDKADLLKRFKQDTYVAIEEKISLNPILNSFQKTVNQYGIDHDLIEAFFKSMEMDLEQVDYNQKLFEQYIYGSAEVVGLMCLKVFCNGDEKLYQELVPSARSLGAAFQKVNFLRDLKSDYNELGRMYFPNTEFHSFKSCKAQLEADIEKDFKDALEGIKRLPKPARRGVYLAYKYYYKLFEKIKSKDADQVLSKRIRVPNGQKAIIYFQSLLNPYPPGGNDLQIS